MFLYDNGLSFAGRAGIRGARGGDAGVLSPARPLNPQPTIIMNTDRLKGNWNITKGKLKQKYANLTDDDLQYVEGKEDELYGRIQKRTGETREQINRFLAEDAKHTR
jgi:uncharacterized protein YjbJ (UPF0337 family)